jgi:hypothetical protein
MHRIHDIILHEPDKCPQQILDAEGVMLGIHERSEDAKVDVLKADESERSRLD